MNISVLEKLIKENSESFDNFIRDNFYTHNLEIVKKFIDYNSDDMSVDYEENDITIEMHSCGEIEDHIFINLIKIDEDYKEFSWLDYTIYAYQHIEQMD